MPSVTVFIAPDEFNYRASKLCPQSGNVPISDALPHLLQINTVHACEFASLRFFSSSPASCRHRSLFLPPVAAVSCAGIKCQSAFNIFIHLTKSEKGIRYLALMRSTRIPFHSCIYQCRFCQAEPFPMNWTDH